MKKLFSIAGMLLILLIFLGGCGPSSVTVRTRPQPPVYARPVAPGSNYVWVDGNWIRSGRGYKYRQGYWAPRRPRHNQYESGYWQQRRNGWYWAPGRWR